MAISISKAQGLFLNSGGLDTLGSNDDYTESISALEQLAGMLIKDTQENLNNSGQIASGALSDSFVASPPKDNGVIQVDVSANFYFDFQNKGVRGTGSGSSSAGYAFKTPYPSDGMVTAIEEWMARGGKATANVPKIHTISKNETKNKAISEIDSAWAVAHTIKVKGITGTGYFDRAIKTTQTYSQEVLGKALAIDIIKLLPNKI